MNLREIKSYNKWKLEFQELEQQDYLHIEYIHMQILLILPFILLYHHNKHITILRYLHYYPPNLLYFPKQICHNRVLHYIVHQYKLHIKLHFPFYLIRFPPTLILIKLGSHLPPCRQMNLYLHQIPQPFHTKVYQQENHLHPLHSQNHQLIVSFCLIVVGHNHLPNHF